MYKKGDVVRVEGTNNLKTIINVLQIKNKFLYICDDNIWYDEELIYPENMKFEIKDLLYERYNLSDYGEKSEILSDVSNYINNVMSDIEFNQFLETVDNIDNIDIFKS